MDRPRFAASDGQGELADSILPAASAAQPPLEDMLDSLPPGGGLPCQQRDLARLQHTVARQTEPRSDATPDPIAGLFLQQVQALQLLVASLNDQVERIESIFQARLSELQDTVEAQRDHIRHLQALLEIPSIARVTRPTIVDLVGELPTHPTVPPYEQRSRDVSMLVVHHTDSSKKTTVQQIAQYHVFGERRDQEGRLVKAQWPGIGYHFIIAPDGAIYQGQPESARSNHVGGEPNDYSVGISLIGRFMRRGYDGKEQPTEDQVPTQAQIASTGHLAAWLMQAYRIPLARVLGHRDVWPKATVCPGEHWKTESNWWGMLEREIRATMARSAGRIEHYLLFWQHGDRWAESDWSNAQPYIRHFRPTCGFSVDDAMLAQHVTIVGGSAGVSTLDENRLRSAGAEVHRLDGKDEAETKRLLDELVARDTPWPGATPLGNRQTPATGRDLDEEPDVPLPDEWTVPDDWEAPAEPRRRSAASPI